MFVSGVGAVISYAAESGMRCATSPQGIILFDGDHDHTQCVEAKQQLCYGFRWFDI